VLARTLEHAGLSTLLITPMPYWAEKVGTPRTLAVEYPFGHPLGMPGKPEMQLEVLTEALEALQTIHSPGKVIHSDLRWPEAVKKAIEEWQPREPSPIIAELRPQIREMIRQMRKS
jgi:D-proline reductase (dithiol) PrdB